MPELWGSELATSTVIMAQQVETLDAPLSPEEQIVNPYTIGTMRIVPVTDSIFASSDELSLVLPCLQSPSQRGQQTGRDGGVQLPSADERGGGVLQQDDAAGTSMLKRSRPRSMFRLGINWSLDKGFRCRCSRTVTTGWRSTSKTTSRARR